MYIFSRSTASKTRCLRPLPRRTTRRTFSIIIHVKDLRISRDVHLNHTICPDHRTFHREERFLTLTKKWTHCSACERAAFRSLLVFITWPEKRVYPLLASLLRPLYYLFFSWNGDRDWIEAPKTPPGSGVGRRSALDPHWRSRSVSLRHWGNRLIYLS